MHKKADILVFGTGTFAARIVFDLAATADAPTHVVIAGRNSGRLAWLETAARARAHMFQRAVTVSKITADLHDASQTADTLHRTAPAVVLQAASMQSGSVIAARGNAWSRIIAEGGLSAATVFQAVLSARVARACAEAAPDTRCVNACFPDVVNELIGAMGLPVACGIGNIQILAHSLAGALDDRKPSALALLAHYQNLAAWRRPPAERAGKSARVWLNGVEIDDVYERFRDVQLTPEPVIDISGAAAVPLLLSLVHGRDWRGHVPGPGGLPGGYPVRVAKGQIALDLPPGLTREAAIAWNRAHEAANGLVIEGEQAIYTGRLRDLLAQFSPELARGFPVRDLDMAGAAMQQLRDRLLVQEA